MELYQIRYFLAVCETLNFTRAAEQCRVAQPSLTRAIKKLEDELGGELFRRERSRTHLTDLGRAMMPPLQQSLESAMAAKAQAESYGKGETAPLTLGLSATIALPLIQPALSEVSKALPGLELHLVRDAAPRIIQQLEDGEIEVCITALGEVNWERIDQWPLFTEDFVLLVPADHRLAGEKSAGLAALKDQQLLLQSRCEHAAALPGMLEALDIPLKGRHEISDAADVQTSVASGLGIAVAPNSAPLQEAVISVPLSDGDLSRSVSLFAVSGRRYSPAASAFIRLMRSSVLPPE